MQHSHTLDGPGSTVKMRTEADAAVAKGGVGALYVRILAAHNLVTEDSAGQGASNENSDIECDCTGVRR